ncbi:energy transducer TonB [Antarcticibacterium flavum]|uniref:Energy transducer TonB n=1 Tax=Antarcticibacterium flavum TaxID=2058175 RepID=A0A5B7X1G0_9FLAO|nr:MULTISPECIES: energy transducer TonB [Antarcticibacterium]MCM4158658.1 energy transducer TonB [Antarcticibacterium sp. W02-3]QCY68512.1 energy transducer TonB [Antarcticibacterium flavum]
MEAKKNYKADLSKRSLLFLQCALILVLLLIYVGIEWKTYAATNEYQEQMNLGELDDDPVPVTVLATPPPPKVPGPPTEIVEVPDDADVEEDPVASTEPDVDEIADIKDIKEAIPEEPIEPVPFEFIEDVPVFPGCEGLSNNADRKACMSEKISGIVNKRFNRDLGSQLGLKGLNRVLVLFQIDAAGNIVGVQSRAPHPKLEEEAESVINTLPRMQPGKQRGKPVPVSYALPIMFKVQD